jgi:hypothetical protein
MATSFSASTVAGDILRGFNHIDTAVCALWFTPKGPCLMVHAVSCGLKRFLVCCRGGCMAGQAATEGDGARAAHGILPQNYLPS